MQASAVVRPVGPGADRVPSLHFTFRVIGINKAAFDGKKLAAWKATLKTALPGAPDLPCWCHHSCHYISMASKQMHLLTGWAALRRKDVTRHI